MRVDQADLHHWLEPGYRPPPCDKCHGKTRTCKWCGGSGLGVTSFSRTDAIRWVQEAVGLNACYGVLGKRRRGCKGVITPENCGSDDCPYRQSCVGLHLNDRYHPDRIREESIEHLSRLFLHARAIEHHTPHLTPFQAEIRDLVQHWDADTPQVAVLGAFSSGKSTLLNRLVGKALLPATRTPTTAVVTSIRHGDHAYGVLHFRSMARLTLVSQDARSPDPSAIQALRVWLRDPAGFCVQTINEIDKKGQSRAVDRQKLIQELDALTRCDEVAAMQAPTRGRRLDPLRRAIGRRPVTPTACLSRTFEILFNERKPRRINLSGDEQIADFGQHLTDPHLALALNRATCYLPDPRLRSLNFLDTAGLCSPVGFHKEVTTELLKRRPDKILVLLDARRLDCPTNGEALKVLGRFVSVPDDYRHVTFALTFWDLAVRTHMVEDSEPELDFNSPTLRASVNRRFAKSKREELLRLLSSWVGVECESSPIIFTLGLGQQAPPEMHMSIHDLWQHLEEDCRGWVGVEMWAKRWQAAKGLAKQIAQLHAEATSSVEKAWKEANDNTDIDANLARLGAQSRQVRRAFDRAETSLRSAVEAQRSRMAVEISALESKSELLKYLDSGYRLSANATLDAVQAESKRQGEALLDLYPGARALESISLDRKLLGLDDSARKRARAKISGFSYGAKSCFDFFFGGLVELNKGSRAAAREILRAQARDTIDIFDGAVDRWAAKARLVCEQAVAQYAEQAESLSRRKDDAQSYAEGLEWRVKFLRDCKDPLTDLCASVERFTDGLARYGKLQNPAR